MGSYPPSTHKHILRLLEKLGFVRARRVGKGKHIKFVHPSRFSLSGQRPFITVPTTIHPIMAKVIVKEIMRFGFSEKEIREKC